MNNIRFLFSQKALNNYKKKGFISNIVFFICSKYFKESFNPKEFPKIYFILKYVSQILISKQNLIENLKSTTGSVSYLSATL